MINFELTLEQKEMRQMARRFAREVIKPAERELDLWQHPEEVYKSALFWDVWKQAYELGFHRLLFPRQVGGLSEGTMEDFFKALLVYEELAWGGLGFSLGIIANTVPGLVVSLFTPQRKDLIEEFVVPFCEDTTGKYIGAWAVTEPDVGSDLLNYVDMPPVKVSARKEGDVYIINGTKSDFVSNGGIARIYLAYASINPKLGMRGNAAFMVPSDLPGVSTGRPLDKLGIRCLNQAPVYFEDVEVPESYRVIPPEHYVDLTRTIFGITVPLCACLCVGVARAAYEYALEYAKERRQGGRPIIEHHAMGMKLHGMYTLIEASRNLIWKAVWDYVNSIATQSPPNIPLSFSTKVFAARAGMEVAADAVQIMGGYGISKEYPVEKLLRDIKLMSITDGTSEILTAVASRML